MAADTPLDRFKAVLGGAARALADEAEVELAFTADAPTQAGRAYQGADAGADAAGRSGGRGARVRRRVRAAAQASRHRAARDAPRRARRWRARCSMRSRARGSRRWGRAAIAGIADNLDHALDMRLRSDPITRARSRDEVPLSTALGLHGARAADRASRRPPSRQPGSRWSATGSRRRAAATSTRWRSRSTISARSPRLATKLLEDLELVEGDMIPNEDDEGGSDDEGTEDEQDERRRRRGRGRAGRGRGRGARRAARSRERRGRGAGAGRRRFRGMPTASPATRARRGCCRCGPTGRVSDLPPQFDYKPFTTAVRRGDRGDRTVRRRGARPAARRISTSSSSICRAR